MKNYDTNSTWTHQDYDVSETSAINVFADIGKERVEGGEGRSGEGSTVEPQEHTPQDTPLAEQHGLLGVGFLILIALLLLSRFFSRKFFGKTSIIEVDLLNGETPKVRKAIERLYETHPKACRNCHGSATEPEFWKTGRGEEECHACYARGRDPYDTTLQMKKDGDYKISPTHGLDPLYRGYALEGQKILAMREEEADQWEA